MPLHEGFVLGGEKLARHVIGCVEQLVGRLRGERSGETEESNAEKEQTFHLKNPEWNLNSGRQ